MCFSTPPLRLLILTITLLIPITIRAALPAVDSQQQPLPSLAPMLEQTLPAVVNIFTTTHVESQRHPLLSDPFFRRFFFRFFCSANSDACFSSAAIISSYSPNNHANRSSSLSKGSGR